MTKDPAFLFYPGDWISGTMDFTLAEQGAYLVLVMCQFNTDRLTLEKIKRILKNDFETVWPAVSSKFEIDENGLYYNQRIEKEKEKRGKFCEHQKNNILKRWNKEIPNEYHGITTVIPYLENENEDVNVLKDSKEKEKIEMYEKETELITRLMVHVRENFKTAKPEFDKYAKDLEKLQRLDKVSLEDIEKIISYLEKNETDKGFSWSEQIGSMAKLRERSKNTGLQYWEMVLKATNGPRSRNEFLEDTYGKAIEKIKNKGKAHDKK